MANRIWLQQVAIAIDQLGNALLAGYADETLSARSYRCRNQKRRWFYARKIINAIFFWQDDHCHEAYMSEQLRRHYPKEYRNQ